MKGLKTRTPPDAVTIDIMQALGSEAQQIKFSERLSPRAAAERAIEAVVALARDIGIPRYVDKLGIPHSAIADIAKDGMTNSRQILPNPREVTHEGMMGMMGILHEAFSPV